MKRGFGTVQCGGCGQKHAVAWNGEVYYMNCMDCGFRMRINRQRLKHFETLKSDIKR